MKKHKITFQVPYYDTDKSGRVTTYNILRYFEETSSSHTDTFSNVDGGINSLNYGWMLYRWKLKINEYPKAKDKVQVETWVSKVDRFYIYREFRLLNDEDEVLGVASTVWIMVDMKKKRPVRIQKTFINMLKIIDESNFTEFEDFKDKLEIINNLEFKVRRSDIDYNNHVNNTKYLLWIVESVPNYIYEDYMMTELEIIYKKEIKYGETILSGHTKANKNGEQTLFTHEISGKENGNKHAYGISKWVKRLI